MSQQLTALVIRASEELTDEFKEKVCNAHPGMEVEFVDIDPRSAQQTFQEALAAGKNVIVLLRQDPLIKGLLDHGIPCIPILPGSDSLRRIKDMQVNFEDYVPNTP